MGLELRQRHMLDRQRVVSAVDDHDISAAVVVGGGEEGVRIGEDIMVDLERVRGRIEVGERGLAEIRSEDESLASERSDGVCRRAAAGAT